MEYFPNKFSSWAGVWVPQVLSQSIFPINFKNPSSSPLHVHDNYSFTMGIGGGYAWCDFTICCVFVQYMFLYFRERQVVLYVRSDLPLNVWAVFTWGITIGKVDTYLLRLDTGDTQKSLHSPPNHFFGTQTVFYYLLSPRSDIFWRDRNSWHPDQKLYVRLTPTHCFTVLLLRITPALLLSLLSGCSMLSRFFLVTLPRRTVCPW